tara:strand:- start:873 stop:1304 length:432 start_codon:yes stop_codon:yes gene_type:complete
MTMSIVRGLTTLNTKVPKRKILSVKQRENLKVEHKSYNKRLKQQHLNHLQMTFEEYIDYTQGCFIPRSTNQVIKKAPMPKVRETQFVPSITTEPIPSGGTKRDWKEQQERIEISKQYPIVPAYNKGPYMVVSKEDLKTAGKKV